MKAALLAGTALMILLKEKREKGVRLLYGPTYNILNVQENQKGVKELIYE